MLKHIKNLLERNSLYIACAVTLLITYLSLIKINHNIPIKVNNLDKYEHLTAYCTLGYSWLLVFRNYPKKIYVILGVIVFGIIIEFLQTILTSYRTGDFYDVIANSTGVLLSILIYSYHNKAKL